MSWFMSVAAGLAIGYFIYQVITNNNNGGGKTLGRLHKSASDRKIAGVCGGIAETLNTDPTIVRLVFALLLLGWGSGLLVYILMAIILPEE